MTKPKDHILKEHFARIESRRASWFEPTQAPRWIASAAAVIDRAVRAVVTEDAVSEESPFAAVGTLIDHWGSVFSFAEKDVRGPHRQTKVLNALTDLCVSVGDFTHAERICRLALESAEISRLMAEAAKCKLVLGDIYFQCGQWDESIYWLCQAREDYRKLHDPVGESDSLLSLGRLHYRRGAYAQASQVYLDALRIAQRTGQAFRVAQIHYHLGVLRRMRCGDEETFGYLREALAQFESIRDLGAAADCLNNLGLLHMRKGLFREAAACFDKSLEYCHRSSNLSLMVFVYLNRASFSLLTNDPALAVAGCGKALELILRLRDPVGLAKANRVWGDLYWRAHMREASELFYKESMLLYETLGLPLGQANCYLEYGQILCSMEEWGRGVTYLSAARDLYRLLDLEQDAQKLDETLQQAEKQRTSAKRKSPTFVPTPLPLLTES
jgi:tetratricopeptide (TPR) repeat protein